MEYTVMLYKNTGFNSSNIPDSPQLLDTITDEHKTSVPSVFLNQNNDLSEIRVQALWEGLRNVDYCRIGDCYYFVTNVFMNNEEVGTLSLQLDAVTTINLLQMDFIDGWCSRRIIPQSEQNISNYQENIIEEPWTPQQPLRINVETDIVKSINNDKTTKNFVLATVDLTKITKTAEEYVTESANPIKVAVPKVPQLDSSNYVTYTMTTSNSGYRYTYPNASLYSTDVDIVAQNIVGVRLLGIESCLIGAYSVPNIYVASYTTSDGLVQDIGNKSYTYTADSGYEYYSNIENKKVFALYNMYEIVSLASSNSAQYTFGDLFYTGQTAPIFEAWADVSPNGTPFCRPRYYKKFANDWLGTVKGAKWLNNQLAFTTSSAVVQKVADIQRTSNKLLINEYKEYAGNLLGLQKDKKYFTQAGDMISGISNIGPISTTITQGLTAGVAAGIGSGVALAETAPTVFNDYMTIQDMGQQAMRDSFLRAPQLVYPYSDSIQSYVGNDFNLIHYMLTENDARRFDNFLHRYGESVDEPFKKEYLHKKKNYDYIKMSNCQIKSDVGIRFNQIAEQMFNSGVRIWHVLPNKEALQTGGNPDVS